MSDTKPDSVKVLRDLADQIVDTRHSLQVCREAEKVVSRAVGPRVMVNIKGAVSHIHSDLVASMLASEIKELEAELEAAEYAAHLCVDRALEVLDEPV